MSGWPNKLPNFTWNPPSKEVISNLDDLDSELENSDTELEEHEEVWSVDWQNVDTIKILFPSQYDPTAVKNHEFGQLLLQEKKLREGQMSDALCALCQSLGDKVWLLRKKLRGIKLTKAKENIRKNLVEKMQDVQKHVQAYKWGGHQVLLRMGCEEDWRPITQDDLHLSADISEV